MPEEINIGNGASHSSPNSVFTLKVSNTLGSQSANTTLMRIINNNALTKSSFWPDLALKLVPDAIKLFSSRLQKTNYVLFINLLTLKIRKKWQVLLVVKDGKISWPNCME